jgi:hypothetical protein
MMVTMIRRGGVLEEHQRAPDHVPSDMMEGLRGGQISQEHQLGTAILDLRKIAGYAQKEMAQPKSE